MEFYGSFIQSYGDILNGDVNDYNVRTTKLDLRYRGHYDVRHGNGRFWRCFYKEAYDRGFVYWYILASNIVVYCRGYDSVRSL